MKKRIIAITLGDINGIGPEVALKAVHRQRRPAGLRFVLIGSAPVLAEQARALGFPAPPTWDPHPRTPPRARVTVWDPTPAARLRWRPGRLSAAASAAAAEWIQRAVEGCRAGLFHALVTAPICKQGFHRAGITFPGHTEMLAALTRTRRIAMMLLGGPLRVVIVTRHLPLKDVPGALSRKAVITAVRLTHQSLSWLGLHRRRIGVCGLNPHAGEGGELGREEIQLITPAIRALRKEGLNAVGPLAADVAFHHAARGEYDAVVAMYHDQGLGPLKTLVFDRGVNLTLGLPLVRTSPDHGTAFDLAGRGVANASSMSEALKLASRLALKRNPWKHPAH